MPSLIEIECTESVKTNPRVSIANAVLDCFASGTTIEIRRGGVYVLWTSWGKPVSRRWQCRGGQSFYPVWHRKWAHGGTATTALAQLVRWIQEKPVLPLGTWRYWTGENVALGRARGIEAVRLLQEGGYPDDVPCVLCGESLKGRSLDWWSLDGLSGPCCTGRDGCRQQRDR